MKLRNYITLGLLFIVSILKSQNCTTVQTFEITDTSTILAAITVSDAANNDLSDPLQGICGIDLSFVHDAVGDIEIFLESPSGQSVQLIGPGGMNTENTPFHTWDVGFRPCGQTVTPDPFRSAQWTNLENWFILTNATGTYYPNQGCLEDFNIGPVNGTWNLRISDVAPIYEGELTSITLIFCDETGIECASCEPFAGVLDIEEKLYCQGDPELLLNEAIIPMDSIADPALYDYEYVISEGGLIIDYLQSTDLTGYPAGIYEICGLNILKSNQADKPAADGTEFLNTLRNLANNQVICADITDVCVNIEIKEIPSTEQINPVLCEGEVFEFKGETFDQPGQYFVTFGAAECDSAALIDLRYVLIDGSITSDFPEFSCFVPTIILSANYNSNLVNPSFNWTYENNQVNIPNNTDENISIVVSGTYTLTIESEGCSESFDITIGADGTVPVLTFDSEVLDCNTSTVTIDLESSVPSFYQWVGPDIDPLLADQEDQTVSLPGIYTVTVTDQVGMCITVGTYEVLLDDFVEIPTVVTPFLDCNNLTGIIDVDLVATSYSFSWEFNALEVANTQDLPVSEPGMYTLIVTAPNGCSRNIPVVVDALLDYPTSNFLVDTLDCLTTVADIEHLDMTTGLSYNWTGPSGFASVSSIISATENGIYDVTITSPNDCAIMESIELVFLNRIPDLTITADSLACSPIGGNLSVSTALNIVSTQWSGPYDFLSASNNPVAIFPGIYCVSVITDNGCEDEACFNLERIDALPDVTLIPPSLDCDTFSGEITVTGGSPDLTYNWSGPGLSSTAQNPLISNGGIFTVTITDVNSACQFFEGIEVEPALSPAEITFDAPQLDCDNVEVIIDFESNSALGMYSWETSDGNILQTNADSTILVDQIGTYYLNTINSSGCPGRDSIVITEDVDNPDLTVPISSYVLSCLTPELNITAETNLFTDVEFNWTGPSGFEVLNEQSPEINEPGKYYVTAVRDNGCSSIDSLMVSIDTITPIIDIIAPQLIVNCVDSVAEISAQVVYPGFFDIVWTGPNNFQSTDFDIELREPGIYTLEAMGDNGCIKTADIEITAEFLDPLIQAVGDTLTCDIFVGQLTVNSNETNLQYEWEGPNNFVANGNNIQTSEIGLYIVTVTNALSCKTIDSTYLEIDTIVPTIIPSVSEELNCLNQSTSLNVDSNRDIIEYNWSGPNFSSTLSNPIIFDGGIYLVTVTADNGCVGVSAFEVEEDTIRPFITTENMELNCWDSRVELSAPNNADNASYFWFGPDAFTSDEINPFVNLGGTYYVTVTDDNGCASFDSIIVTPNIEEPNIFVADAALPCDGSPLLLPALSDDPIDEFRWLGPNGFTFIGQIATITEPGEYVLLGIGLNGCISLDTAIITDVPVLPEFEIASETINCYNPTIDLCALFVGDDDSWEWSDGNTILGTDTCQTISTPGEYFLTVLGDNGCEDVKSVIVDIDTISPIAIIEDDVNILCEKREDNLNALNSSQGFQYEYLWTTTDGTILEGETTLEPLILDLGSYQLEVTDITNGCSSIASIQVEEGASTITAVDLVGIEPSCIGFENGFIEIFGVTGGIGPYEYSLDGVNYSGKTLIQFLAPGSYTLFVRDAIGCVFERQVPIGFGTEINVSLGEDKNVQLGDSVLIQGITNINPGQIVNIRWEPDFFDQCDDCLEFFHQVSESITFELIITDENGCVGSDQQTINVDEVPDVFVPSIFSPNGDGKNDEIIIHAASGVNRILNWQIIDRWGNLLHEAKNFTPGDYNFAWDGNFQGEPVNPNVFVYLLEVEYISGVSKLLNGTITLIR